MEGDEIQPTKISKEEYVRFKQWVQDTHGKTRGHLSTEIENALREYRQPDNETDTLTRIEDDLATVKAAVIEKEADGGASPQTDETENTHARADSSKPRPNAPRSEKASYIISEYFNSDGGKTTKKAIQNIVENEFGFEQRTSESYAEKILDSLDARPHPSRKDMYIWGEEGEDSVETDGGEPIV